MINESTYFADGPARTLYSLTGDRTPIGERLAAERNARLLTAPAETPAVVRVAATIGQVPRTAQRAPKGSCRRILGDGSRCGAAFEWNGAFNRLYCNACSSGVHRRGRA